MSQIRKRAAILLVFALVVSSFAGFIGVGTASAAGDQLQRIAGADRFETAAKIAEAKYPSGSNTVIVARSDDFADGLAASVLAGALNAPVLLTKSNELPSATADAITKLGAKKVIVLGSEAAISAEVEAALKNVAGETERIGGADRIETAVKIAQKAKSSAQVAFIVNGWAYADAMTAGSAAFAKGYPVFAVKANELPAAVKDALKALGVKQVVIVGGETVVSSAVAQALAAEGVQVSRIAGTDRIETSVEFAKSQFANASGYSVVNGWNLADAVGAAVFGNPILYAYAPERSNDLPGSVSTLVESTLNANADAKLTVLGGPVAVSDATFNQLSQLVDNAVFKVVSAGATNAKQVEIKFSKAVDKSTVFSNVTTGALNPGVVTIKRTVNDTTDTNKNVDSATDTITGALSADGKTLTLTVDVATLKYFDGTYAVTVSDAVKTNNGEKLTPYAGTFTFSDKTNPTVSNVTYNTITNKIEITFSEPITAVPDVVRVNGDPVTGVAFVANTNQTKVDFTKPASVAAGSTATIYVAGAKDAANNILTPFTGNVTITNDASALQVTSVAQISSNKLKVVFNKSLASNDATINSALSVIIDGVVVAGADVTAALDTNDTSNKTVIVSFGGSYTAPNYFYGSATSKTVTLVFADNVITDVFGKKLAATTQSITMTKDVSGPQAVSAKIASNGADIEVTFDEELSSTIDLAKIVLRKDGVALNPVANAVRKAASGEDAKILVITPAAADLTGGKLAAGTYTVRLEVGAVEDVHTNKNAVANLQVSKSATTTDLTASITTQTGQRNIFEVTFSEDVTAASALNLANYTLDGKALPSGTDIYFKNGAANRTVVIVLPNGSINIGAVGTGTNAILAVSGVQTSSGKTVVPTSGTVLVEDNTPAILQSATLVGNNILKLTFNENITASSVTGITQVLSELEIKAADGTVLSAGTTGAAEVSTSGKDLIIDITPGDSNWTTVISSTTVTITTKDSGAADGLTDLILDANGYKVKAGVSVTLTK